MILSVNIETPDGGYIKVTDDADPRYQGRRVSLKDVVDVLSLPNGYVDLKSEWVTAPENEWEEELAYPAVVRVYARGVVSAGIVYG